LFIDFLASSPITRSNDANSLTSEGESHRQDARTILVAPKTKESFFILAVSNVFGDDSVIVKKRVLGFVERNAMSNLIL
jgi:hypothetical protein